MGEVNAISQGYSDRQKSDWQHTAQIIAMVRNVAVKGKKDAEQLIPFAFEEEVYFPELNRPRRTFDQMAKWHREIFKKQNLN